MKKIKNLVFWVGIFILILATILVKPLSNLDEMWNFNIARCISNGLVPYRDISMIVTPLLGFITAIFLKIFGTEMFITRVLAAVLAMLNITLMYKILKNLKINKVIAKISIFLIVLSLLEFFCLDYNFFVITFILAIISCEIKLQKKNGKFQNIVIGILAGLSVCTKQSIGLLVCMAVVLNRFFFVKSKSEIKMYLKEILYRAIGIFVPIFVFAIYLLITKSFGDFISYSVLGITTFTNKIPYSYLLKSNLLVVSFFAVIAPAFIVIAIIANTYFKIVKKTKSFFYVLTVYSIPAFAIVYPIADNMHLLVASIIPIILIIYTTYRIILKSPKFKYEDTISKYLMELVEIIMTLCIVIYVAFFEIRNMDRLSNLSKYTKTNNFRYMYIDSDLKNSIEEVDKYIMSQEKNVYILDSTSTVYMIPMNRYNKNYDMFMKGNLGIDGEQSIIDNIKDEDAKYLVLKDEYELNWQTPTDVIGYVKENLKRTGSVGKFDVYEKSTEEKLDESKSKDEEVKVEESSKTIE